MPPAFVLSQDQTLRLTSRSPIPRPNQAQRPETQNQDPVTSRASTAKNINPPQAQKKSKPKHKATPSAALQKHAKATDPEATYSQPRTAARASLLIKINNVKQRRSHRLTTRRFQDPISGSRDPPRLVGAVPTIVKSGAILHGTRRRGH